MEQDQLFDLRFEHQTNNFLAEAAKWGKFIAIIGFIFCALMLLGGIFAGSIFATMGQSSSLALMGGGFFTAVYVVFAVLWFMPFLYLFNFASKMQVALRNNDQATLNLSFQNLKSCFKFIGIFTIIMLSIYALIFFFGIATSLGTAL